MNQLLVDWFVVVAVFIVVIMAKNTSLVLLGYEDEQIAEKHIAFVDYTTNKIGGKPVSIEPPNFIQCKICNAEPSKLSDPFLLIFFLCWIFFCIELAR